MGGLIIESDTTGEESSTGKLKIRSAPHHIHSNSLSVVPGSKVIHTMNGVGCIGLLSRITLAICAGCNGISNRGNM